MILLLISQEGRTLNTNSIYRSVECVCVCYHLQRYANGQWAQNTILELVLSRTFQADNPHANRLFSFIAFHIDELTNSRFTFLLVFELVCLCIIQQREKNIFEF